MRVALAAGAALVTLVIGVGGAGVTTALLTARADVPSAVITAGDAWIRINGAAGTSDLGAKALSPTTPARWTFTVGNSGSVPLALTAKLSSNAAPSAPAYAAVVGAAVSVAPSGGSCASAPTGANPVNGATPVALGALAVGATSTYCLVLSLPVGTDATGSGTPFPFSLTIDAVQVTP